ncbi:hypothetical protein Gasu2_68610 [Galdieria sulphuraria]|nr:hypothetical protein Gasu2_68610 [Galdieria sulphuraria]
MKDCVFELFRPIVSTKPSSPIQLPHLFVGQLKPLKTDSQVNLGMLGIFASCVIVISSILKRIFNKKFSKSSSLSESYPVTLPIEQDQQPFYQLERTFHALENLKNTINDDAEHASDLFLKLLQEASIRKLPSSPSVTTRSLEQVVTEILKEVDKKMRFYHSLFTILEKFSQQVVNELETNLKEASENDDLFREIMQDITNVSYTEMKTMPRFVSELYEQLRNNHASTPISQKCEKVSLDITTMKRTLQLTMSKLQALRTASLNGDIEKENSIQVNGAYREIEPHEWLRILETKTNTSKFSSLQAEIENIPQNQRWTFLSSTLERVHGNPTELNSVKQLIQDKDEEIAFLRQQLHETEKEKLKTQKVRSKSSRNSSDSEKTVGSTTTSNKRTRSKRKMEASESEINGVRQ